MASELVRMKAEGNDDFPLPGVRNDEDDLPEQSYSAWSGLTFPMTLSAAQEYTEKQLGVHKNGYDFSKHFYSVSLGDGDVDSSGYYFRDVIEAQADGMKQEKASAADDF